MRKELRYIWVNGHFLTQKDISSTLSRNGIFEYIPIYNGKILHLQEHIDRLFSSAKYLILNISFTKEKIKDACLEIIKINQLKHGFIHISSFTNEQDINQCIITCANNNDRYLTQKTKTQPIKLEISTILKKPEDFLTHSAKANSLYLLNDIAKERAIANNYDDALILDYRYNILGSTSSNFFIVKNEALHTPSPEFCINGLTRQMIIKLAQESNISIAERRIHIDELKDADEAFLTDSQNLISPVSQIGNHQYNNNPLTQLICNKLELSLKELS
jgi:branched-chain amino acid aminotransferase